MELRLLSRLSRLKGVRALMGFFLIVPAEHSLKLFKVISCEIDELIAEWEVDLELKALVIEQAASATRQRSADGHLLFDDGDHLVEDQMHPEP